MVAAERRDEHRRGDQDGVQHERGERQRAQVTAHRRRGRRDRRDWCDQSAVRRDPHGVHVLSPKTKLTERPARSSPELVDRESRGGAANIVSVFGFLYLAESYRLALGAWTVLPLPLAVVVGWLLRTRVPRCGPATRPSRALPSGTRRGLTHPY